MTDTVTVPRSFSVVAVLLLLWALMGDFSYIVQVTRGAAVGITLNAYDTALLDAMPEWVWAAYAIAVWVGTAGAIALLLQRKLAVPFYAISLICVVLQFGYTLGATDLIAVKGFAVAAGFPIVIFVIGIFQLWWSRKCSTRGWLR